MRFGRASDVEHSGVEEPSPVEAGPSVVKSSQRQRNEVVQAAKAIETVNAVQDGPTLGNMGYLAAKLLDKSGKELVRTSPRVVVENSGGEALVKDYGVKIAVTPKASGMVFSLSRARRQQGQQEGTEAVGTALKMARERFGDPVRVNSKSKKFRSMIIEQAVAQGVTLEFTSKRDAAEYKRTLEGSEKSKENVLSSSHAIPPKEVHKGIAI
jgi:hypothetical protein